MVYLTGCKLLMSMINEYPDLMEQRIELQKTLLIFAGAGNNSKRNRISIRHDHCPTQCIDVMCIKKGVENSYIVLKHVLVPSMKKGKL